MTIAIGGKVYMSINAGNTPPMFVMSGAKTMVNSSFLWIGWNRKNFYLESNINNYI